MWIAVQDNKSNSDPEFQSSKAVASRKHQDVAIFHATMEVRGSGKVIPLSLAFQYSHRLISWEFLDFFHKEHHLWWKPQAKTALESPCTDFSFSYSSSGKAEPFHWPCAQGGCLGSLLQRARGTPASGRTGNGVGMGLIWEGELKILCFPCLTSLPLE